MRLSAKDTVGVLLFLGTCAVLAAHNSSWHQSTHSDPIGDRGGSVAAALGARPVAFVDFHVVPMDGDRVLRNRVVIVRGERIERVGRVGFVEIPRGALRIAGGGTRYLAPGLTDAHAHLHDEPEDWLPLFVANGVTTVFNLEGNERHLVLRDRIRAGEEFGPTVYTAGPYVTETGVRTSGDARAVVRRQADLGYDFLKVHGDLSLEAYRALTDAGRDLGIPIIGHAPRNLSIAEVLGSGQVALSHAEEIIQIAPWQLDERDLVGVSEAVAEAGVWVTPTLAYFEGVAQQQASPGAVAAMLDTETAGYLTPALRASWDESRAFVGRDSRERADILEMLEFHGPLVRALYDAGVPLLAGTDAPFPVSVPGFSLHAEIDALRGAGLSGYEALRTATRNPGRFVSSYVQADDDFGIIRSGARADLLVVAGDPRADPMVLGRPDGVMVRGRWYDRAALDRMLTEVAQRR